MCHLVAKNGETFKRCGHCLNVYYCSRKCQKQDQKQHKLVCALGDPLDCVQQKDAVHHDVKQATRMFLSSEPRAPVQGEDWVRQVHIVHDEASAERLSARIALGLPLHTKPSFEQLIPAKPIEGECQRLQCHEAGTLKCGRCKQVYYCSRQCQKQDWCHTHKHVCKPAEED